MEGRHGLVDSLLARDSMPLPDDVVNDTRVFMRERCPLLARLEGGAAGAGLVGILLPAIIDIGFEVLVKELRATAGEYMATSTAVTASHLLRYRSAANGPGAPLRRWVEPNFNCLVVVRGAFGDPKHKHLVREHWKAHEGALTELGVVRDPDFYLEMTPEVSSDGTAFILRPRAVEFAKAASRIRTPRHEKAVKDVTVSVTWRVPSGTSGVLGVSLITFGRLRVQPVVVDELSFARSWIWIPAPSFDPQRLDSRPSMFKFAPVSVLVTVVESEPSEVLASRLADLISSSKSAVSQAAKEATKSAPQPGSSK